MAYHWKPNRDSGCVRSHRNPDTKRRYNDPTGAKMNNLAKTYRAYEHNALKAAMPLLKTGLFDLAIDKRRRMGWDEGDPFMGGSVREVAVQAIEVEDEQSYDDECPCCIERDYEDWYSPGRAQYAVEQSWSDWLRANSTDPRFS